ncbi:hypothetical protein Poli38472_008034 [Pythium oligandrum]|uniref:BZIP domain-containing protein n=1 Tax=Pythium oligandrum TaxID=41045 RepID=A0A8K1CKZ5_PYTOL|nr:hypothetical protein Poli38472_008034 [Pythium oligandrum]|eukprot:TMW65392.1 hypothetical protein Poli38472_008034 [Pythium oligandrum]
MRLGAITESLPEMESKPKLEVDDARRYGNMTGMTETGDRTWRTSTGKRSTRDQQPDAASSPSISYASDAVAGLDLSSVSSLCHELIAKKRMMLNAVTLASPTSEMDGSRDGVKGSDDEPGDHSDNGMRSVKLPTAPLSEEDMIKRKAQRRREQVRAASRRCRDRQRRETEELRMKVFKLEEFIAHTLQTYESELRRQQLQIEGLQQENESLRYRLGMSASPSAPPTVIPSVPSPPVAPAPAPVAPVVHQPYESPIKSAPISDEANTLSDDIRRIKWDAARIQNVHSTVNLATRALVSIRNTITPVPEVSRQAFGWQFEMWDDGALFYAKTEKFFRGVRAYDVAQRFFNVDYGKYMETFHEVKDKKVLKQLGPNIKIVQTVKQHPGKELSASVTCNFIARDEQFAGERWVTGIVSVGSAQHLFFTHEDECNGYMYEDVTRVMSDGREVRGCVAYGLGRYQSNGMDLKLLVEELAKATASVVLRWESLFINDYMIDEEEHLGDIESLSFADE